MIRTAGIVLLLTVALVSGQLALSTGTHGPLALGRIAGVTPILSMDFGTGTLSIPFLALLAILCFAVAIWSTKGARPGDALAVGIFAATMLAVLAAQSVAAFVATWELMALVSALVVAAHHERRAVRRAVFTYLIVLQTGALCIVAAFGLLAAAAGSGSFAAISQNAAQLGSGARNAVFALALAGFGSKAGLMPLHFWLPRAHPVAPSNGSALLSGAMLKIAVYGLMLAVFTLDGPAPPAWGYVILAVGSVSCVGGVLYAVVEHDLKRLLAYHSIENVGIVMLGFGAAILMRAEGSFVLADIALTAALFHAINHGLFKGLLFLGSGVIAESAGTVDLEKLGGLASSLRWTGPLFLIGCAAISALPPLNGFASEWLTFRSLMGGTAEPYFSTFLALTAAIGTLALTSGLAAACFVKAYGTAFLGAPRSATVASSKTESFDPCVLGQLVLAAPCVVLGFFPMFAIARLAGVAAIAIGGISIPFDAGAMMPSVVPLAIVALPIIGGLSALAVAASRGIRREPAWSCGSPVTSAAQYTATAFSKPLRTIFAFVLHTDRQRTVHTGASTWFPTRITYRTHPRYLIDEAVRSIASAIQRIARSARALQGGRLRYYIAYALAAFALAVWIAR